MAVAAHFCLTEKVAPEMLIVPLRDEPLAFAATVKVTAPLPMPPLSEVMVIQPTLLVALQMHSSEAITVVLPLPPMLEKLCDTGVSA
jgi:hypothetical protein